MQPFRVHILGCGSALPTGRHNPSCQIVEIRGKLFMIDCGEGAQLQLRRFKINFSKIQAVLISHIHGDHVLGLIGMLCTFGLQGRTAPLHIYAPADYEPLFLMEKKMFCNTFDYELIFHPLDTSVHQVIYEDRSLTIETLPLVHRMPCSGFVFREKEGARHIKRDMIDFYQVPVSQINNIKAGLDWTSPEGELIHNHLLTEPADPCRMYAYCSDTRYSPSIYNNIIGVNLLYHESTYTDDYHDLAVKYLHSTAKEAGQAASLCQAGKLLLGHFSKRYTTDKPFLDEAKTVFSNTQLANEGLTIDVE